MIRYDQPPLPIKYSLSVNALSESVGLWKLPEEWKWHTLKDIASASAEQIRPGDYPNEIFNFWGLDSIESGQWQEPLPNLVEGRTIKSNCIKFDQSHVLYAKLRPYLNKVIVPSIAGIGSTEWVPLKPAPKIIDRKFLAFYLRTPSFVVYANRNSTGARMPRVRMSSLWEAPVPIPYPDNPIRSLAEQRRIVARIETLLSEVRETRKINEAIIEDTNQLMSAMLVETFNEIEHRFRGTKSIDEITSVTSGGTPSRSRQDYYTGDIPWVKTGELQDNFIYDAEEHITQEAIDNSNAKIFPPDTLLIAMYGQGKTRGRTGILAVDAATNQACCAILPSKNWFESRYLQFWFRNIYEELRRQSEFRGGNQPNLNTGMIKALKPPLPDLNTQRQVIAYFDSVQLEIKAMQEIQAQDKQVLEQVEQAILTQAFRGEL